MDKLSTAQNFLTTLSHTQFHEVVGWEGGPTQTNNGAVWAESYDPTRTKITPSLSAEGYLFYLEKLERVAVLKNILERLNIVFLNGAFQIVCHILLDSLVLLT